MQFEIKYGGTIEVYKEGQVFLKAQVRNPFKTYLSFYKESQLILKSSLFAFFIWRKIAIKYQNLPYPIEVFEQEGTFKVFMVYGSNVIRAIQHPFKREGFTFYLNDAEIARIVYPNKIQFGTESFTLISDTDDEITNLYLLLAFLIPYHPS